MPKLLLPILLALIGFAAAQGPVCNAQFLSGYGFDGLPVAVEQQMLLCQNVEFTCCSNLDEVKFQRKWNQYYLKKHEKIFTSFSTLLEKADEIATFLSTFVVDQNKGLFKPGNLPIANELVKGIKAAGLTQFSAAKKELALAQAADLKRKSTLVCSVCDARNHLRLSTLDSKFYLSPSYCKGLVSDFGPYVQVKGLKMDVVMALFDQLTALIDSKHSALAPNFNVIGEIAQFRDALTTCYSVAEFSINRCEKFCSFYQVDGISKGFVAHFKYYSAQVRKLQIVKSLIKQQEQLALVLKAAATASAAPAANATTTPAAAKSRRLYLRQFDNKYDNLKHTGRSNRRLMYKERILEGRNKKRGMLQKLKKIDKNLRNYKHLVRKMKTKNKRMINKIVRINKKISRKLKKKPVEPALPVTPAVPFLAPQSPLGVAGPVVGGLPAMNAGGFYPNGGFYPGALGVPLRNRWNGRYQRGSSRGGRWRGRRLRGKRQEGWRHRRLQDNKKKTTTSGSATATGAKSGSASTQSKTTTTSGSASTKTTGSSSSATSSSSKPSTTGSSSSSGSSTAKPTTTTSSKSSSSSTAKPTTIGGSGSVTTKSGATTGAGASVAAAASATRTGSSSSSGSSTARSSSGGSSTAAKTNTTTSGGSSSAANVGATAGGSSTTSGGSSSRSGGSTPAASNSSNASAASVPPPPPPPLVLQAKDYATTSTFANATKLNATLIETFLTKQFNIRLASNYYFSPKTQLSRVSLDNGNEFFEGAFLKDFSLGFRPGGADLNYTVTGFLTADRSTVLNETQRLMELPRKSYLLPTSNLTTAAVMQQLSVIGVNDYYAFYADCDLVVGDAYAEAGPTPGEQIFFAAQSLAPLLQTFTEATSNTTTTAAASGAKTVNATAPAAAKAAAKPARRMLRDGKRTKSIKV